LTTATFFHGPDGIGGVPLTEVTRAAVRESAPALLCRLAREHAGQLNLVAVGPLTNVALACRLDPAFSQRLRRLVVMGGAATVAGNVTPAAEANFYNDPEAAAIVFESGTDLTMVGLDVTLKALFEAQRFAMLKEPAAVSDDPVARLSAAVLEWYLRADQEAGLEGSPLHDPLAVAALARPDLVACRDLHVEIETQGRFTAGQSVANVAGYVEALTSLGDHDDVSGLTPSVANCHVALDVETAAFVDLFCARLGLTAGDPRPPGRPGYPGHGHQQRPANSPRSP
jgi:purine nucleosidase